MANAIACGPVSFEWSQSLKPFLQLETLRPLLAASTSAACDGLNFDRSQAGRPALQAARFCTRSDDCANERTGQRTRQASCAQRDPCRLIFISPPLGALGSRPEPNQYSSRLKLSFSASSQPAYFLSSLA